MSDDEATPGGTPDRSGWGGLEAVPQPSVTEWKITEEDEQAALRALHGVPRPLFEGQFINADTPLQAVRSGNTGDIVWTERPANMSYEYRRSLFMMSRRLAERRAQREALYRARQDRGRDDRLASRRNYGALRGEFYPDTSHTH